MLSTEVDRLISGFVACCELLLAILAQLCINAATLYKPYINQDVNNLGMYIVIVTVPGQLATIGYLTKAR